jgi:uncharacterized protein (TIGR03437 family)
LTADLGERLLSTVPEFRTSLPPGKVIRRGTVLELYGPATGLYIGEGDGAPVVGENDVFTAPASGSPLYHTTSLPVVRLQDWRAKVLFSGLAPGQAGVWQINILIPEDVSTSFVPVQIFYEGYQFRTFDIEIE